MGRLIARFGVFVTVAVGTLWCAYLLTLLALILLPAELKPHDQTILVAWIAQTLLQLVLLPIVVVVQNAKVTASDQRADDAYKDAEAVLHEALQIQAHLQAHDAILQRLVSGRQDQFGKATASGDSIPCGEQAPGDDSRHDQENGMFARPAGGSAAWTPQGPNTVA